MRNNGRVIFKKFRIVSKRGFVLVNKIKDTSLEHINIDIYQDEIVNIKYNRENLYPTYPNVSAQIQVNEFKKALQKATSMYPVR